MGPYRLLSGGELPDLLGPFPMRLGVTGSPLVVSHGLPATGTIEVSIDRLGPNTTGGMTAETICKPSCARSPAAGLVSISGRSAKAMSLPPYPLALLCAR